MYGCESWTIKKAECQRTDAFELCLLDGKEVKPVNPEGNQPWKSIGLMLKLKLHYFGYLMQRVNSLEKSLIWERLRQEEKGMTEDEMVGWHQRLNGHEFEQVPGDGEGQGSLVCCSPWGHKELDMTEGLNNNNNCYPLKFWCIINTCYHLTWKLLLSSG